MDERRSKPTSTAFQATHAVAREGWADLPADYAERTYAGVLGKIIGVYLGRPVENWSHERIMAEIGEIQYYIHEQRGRHLVITDDDISGTFTFLRAMNDYGCPIGITPEQIGQTWLNYLIEKTTILWWGGLGNSTEHTAYLRLKHGIKAPESGSRALNTKVVSEQIGAQIFVEGWGMIVPGQPRLAADLARRSASVSHDGEGIYGAQVVASMVSQAYVEHNLDTLIDTALEWIPTDSDIARMIGDIRNWHRNEKNWKENRARLEANYGYDKYLGNVHIVPNHGLIILSLLHGEGDFQKSLMIVNTCGWDTDCNSGNVGSILGVRNGLSGIEDGPDWRGPVADRLFLPSADPGRSITDAVRETYEIINITKRLRGHPQEEPKGGAKFHFSLPGSVQGFRAESGPEVRGTVETYNDNSKLSLRFQKVATGRSARVSTSTFIPEDLINLKTGYVLVASPTLYPGQTVRARLLADPTNPVPIRCNLYIARYDETDSLTIVRGPQEIFVPAKERELEWQIPDLDGYPVAEVGIELTSDLRSDGTLHLDWLTWNGVPDTEFKPTKGTMWGRCWAKAIDRFEYQRDAYRYLAQNEGTGLLIQGCREWDDYRFEATIRPQMMVAAGIAGRVQGLRRYYAMQLIDGRVQLVKELDGTQILEERPFQWNYFCDYHMALEFDGDTIRGFVDGERVFTAQDADLGSGAIALVCQEGCMGAETVRIQPLV
ncbi:MAG TPA: ADP-ribosylglycohydrolase family protein [Fimbriimonadaceae bacterium]|nr:ADP-ribosylglycohydrolase family protein [Fimbriimonadaceae bacterium]